ncbi:MAG: 1-acyl-sn-glycerol-3-phosphate acyltransferase [Lachnospiraceae bacterium]|nr:1-acyl-sn-glycerol-3-phosphate acyltransferase [Lachnospiraceae bacterium]
MKKKNTWIKPWHGLVRNIAFAILEPYTKWKYNISIEKIENPENRPFLILMNHQTAFDQFFIGMAFDGPVYYLATEDIFSLGWISRLLDFLVAPIPIKKQTTDLKAVKTCVKVAKEGGTIALFPEGNRTFHGRTLYFKPSIVKLIRLIKLPIIIMRAEGGFGIQPRWSDVVRKGSMRAYPSRIIEPEEYEALSDETLYELLQNELYVDETDCAASFYHKKNAEYMERFLYVCPDCGLTTYKSKNDIVECQKCHQQIQYLPNKKLQGIKKPFPFSTIGQWYDYQCNYICRLDLQSFQETLMYQDKIKLFQVVLYKYKKKLKNSAYICLYGNRIILDGICLDFDSIHSITVLGKNKLNIYTGNQVYQIKGSKSFNALKYVNIYFHYQNVRKGAENNEQFLGL